MGTDSTAADPYAALAAELHLLGGRLDRLGAELLRLRATEGSGAPGTEGIPGAPGRLPQPAPAPADRASPVGTQGGGPRAPRSQLSGARVLAWTGGGVTLLGVVLLLALAASRGWFSPLGRVTSGAVLGVALIGVGLRLHRKVDARVGALALAGTGFATLYLAVAAATALYGFLAPTPALVVALVVAAAGLGLADRWRAQLLGGGVVVGAAVLAPALVWGWLLVALVLALQLAALPVVLRRRWPTLAVVAAAGPALYGAVVGGLADAAERAPTVAVAIGALVAGLATALPAARVLPARPVGALVAVAPVPVLVTAAAWGGWNGAAVAAVAVVALAAFAAVPAAPRIGGWELAEPAGRVRTVRVVAVAAAALALFQATLVALDGSAATVVLLGQAIVATVLAAQLRARLPLAVGAAYGGIGVLIALGRDAPLDGLVHHPSSAYAGPGHGPLVVGAAVSVLVLAFAVALLVAGVRCGLVRPDPGSAALWVPAGVVGLYGATSLVVALALLGSDDRAGFTAGHALVTVSWTAVALVLLARGVRRPALRIAGMVLVAAAVGKLVLFDLVALDGLARVAAFLGAGLVLLAAGTRYARLVTEAEAAK
ncbi:DUF2339 domain-containing protein [Pseudonocardia sp. DLS-67]